MSASTGTVAPQTPITAQPGWYIIETSTGFVGIILHHAEGLFHVGSSYGTVTTALPLAGVSTSDTLPSVLGSAGSQINTLLSELGATATQQAAFVTQADVAAGKQQGSLEKGFFGWVANLVGADPFNSGKQTTQLLISHAGKPSASSGKSPVSTTPSGDVNNPPAAPSLVGLFGSLSFWKGLGLVVGAVLLMLFGLFELRKIV